MHGREIGVFYSLLITSLQIHKTHAQSPPDTLAITLAEVLLSFFLHCTWQMSPMVATEEVVNRAVSV